MHLYKFIQSVVWHTQNNWFRSKHGIKPCPICYKVIVGLYPHRNPSQWLHHGRQLKWKGNDEKRKRGNRGKKRRGGKRRQRRGNGKRREGKKRQRGNERGRNGRKMRDWREPGKSEKRLNAKGKPGYAVLLSLIDFLSLSFTYFCVHRCISSTIFLNLFVSKLGEFGYFRKQLLQQKRGQHPPQPQKPRPQSTIHLRQKPSDLQLCPSHH